MAAQAGNPCTWQQLNAMCASRAVMITAVEQDVLAFQDWLQGQADVDVAALAGYDAGVWTTLKGMAADLAGHAQIFQGRACTLGYGQNLGIVTPYDFRTFCRKVSGGKTGGVGD